ETSDSEFAWKDFQLRCNSDLLGKYGNLVNRVLVFLQTHCGGIVPSISNLERIDQEFLDKIRQLVDEAADGYEHFKIRRVSQLIMELSQLGNVYFDSKHPWKDVKDASTKSRMETTIACCLECLKALALISTPIIPTAAHQVWKMLGYTESPENLGWDSIMNHSVSAGMQLQKPEILFQRIEDATIEKEIQKLHELSQAAIKRDAAPPVPALKGQIEIEDVRKLDLRVGLILKAERVPKSKKLIQLLVDIGLEKRTIVAGIGESYQPEELVGRKVVVVANLKPAALMNVTSQGMVLAGSQEGQFELLSIAGLEPGAIVS
ncbi:MAG: methionine--tRNA ligase subunit beta, partial [Chlamydiales bacterium]